MTRNKTERLDINPDEVFRVAKMCGYSKMIPIGHLATGPGWRCLLVLFILHRYGRFLFRIFIRYEDQLTVIYRRLGRFLGRDTLR